MTETWIPESCTLPSAERPERLAAFDELVAGSVLGQERVSATVLRWELAAGAEPAARALTAKEAACCSFFTFTSRADGDRRWLDVEVPVRYVAVLDALAARAPA